MNMQTFHDYHPYTHTYGKDGIELQDFNKRKCQLFYNFLDANSSIIRVDFMPHCQRHILDSGTWKCVPHKRECHVVSNNSGIIWSYLTLYRIKGVRKSYFVTSHPKYKFADLTVDDLNQIEGTLLEGLVAQMYSEDVSWQYPGYTSLVIIGREEIVLNTLDMACLGTPEHAFLGRMTQ